MKHILIVILMSVICISCDFKFQRSDHIYQIDQFELKHVSSNPSEGFDSLYTYRVKLSDLDTNQDTVLEITRPYMFNPSNFIGHSCRIYDGNIHYTNHNDSL